MDENIMDIRDMIGEVKQVILGLQGVMNGMILYELDKLDGPLENCAAAIKILEVGLDNIEDELTIVDSKLVELDNSSSEEI